MKKNNWVYKVFLWTFILSTIFSFSTNYLSSHASIVVMILIILLVIAIGIIFDMIGASSLTSKESTFHSMNAKKLKVLRKQLNLLKTMLKYLVYVMILLEIYAVLFLEDLVLYLLYQ